MRRRVTMTWAPSFRKCDRLLPNPTQTTKCEAFFRSQIKTVIWTSVTSGAEKYGGTPVELESRVSPGNRSHDLTSGNV
jgi:hypothetical protein